MFLLGAQAWWEPLCLTVSLNLWNWQFDIRSNLSQWLVRFVHVRKQGLNFSHISSFYVNIYRYIFCIFVQWGNSQVSQWTWILSQICQILFFFLSYRQGWRSARQSGDLHWRLRLLESLPPVLPGSRRSDTTHKQMSDCILPLTHAYPG